MPTSPNALRPSRMPHDFASAGSELPAPRPLKKTADAMTSAIAFLKKLFWKLDISPP